jgi:hypothetical protein
MIKSPHTSCRLISRPALPQNLEIHKVFLRFFVFAGQKIRSMICARRFDQRLPNGRAIPPFFFLQKTIAFFFLTW